MWQNIDAWLKYCSKVFIWYFSFGILRPYIVTMPLYLFPLAQICGSQKISIKSLHRFQWCIWVNMLVRTQASMQHHFLPGVISNLRAEVRPWISEYRTQMLVLSNHLQSWPCLWLIWKNVRKQTIQHRAPCSWWILVISVVELHQELQLSRLWWSRCPWQQH